MTSIPPAYSPKAPFRYGELRFRQRAAANSPKARQIGWQVSTSGSDYSKSGYVPVAVIALMLFARLDQLLWLEVS